MNKFLLTTACIVGLSSFAYAADVTDCITAEGCGATSTQYQDFSGKKFSSEAVYAGKMAKAASNNGGNVQLRTLKSEEGIVSTVTGGKIVKIEVEWAAATDKSRQIDIYGSHSAYTTAKDLYASDTQGELIGSMKKENDDKEFFVEGDWEYIGIRSKSGAVYLPVLNIIWDDGADDTVGKPVITMGDNNMVSISAEEGASVYYTLDGEDPTVGSSLYEVPFEITGKCTVKAVAVVGDEVSKVASATLYLNVVGSLAAFVDNGSKDEPTFVNAPVTAIYHNGRNLYLKDADDNYLLSYNSGDIDSESYVNGDVISGITGKYYENAGLPEIVPVSFGEKTAGVAVEPTLVTLDGLSVDMLNHYVVVEGVSIKAASRANNYEISDGAGNTAALYNQFYNSSYYDVVTVPEGDGYKVTGFVSVYNTTLQIVPILVESAVVVEKVSTPEFSVEPGEVEAGTAVEITTATEGATIYYTLDGTEPTSDSAVYEEPVYVDKSLTIKAVAEMEGMSRSDVAVGEYTVSGTSDEKELTATVIIAEQTWTEYTKDAVINWVATDGTEFPTSAVINGSTYPRKYQNVYLRVYSSNGNVITVNAPDGYQFVSVGVYSNRDAVIIDGSEVSSAEGVAVYVFPDNKKTSFTIESIKVDSTIKNTDISKVDLVISKIGDGIGSVSVGDNTPVEYYNLQGVRLSGENLPSGLYIRRQGNSVTKVIVR